MLTVLYIHNPSLPMHISTASEVAGLVPPEMVCIIQGNFSHEPPLWHSQQKEFGDDVVRRTAFLMAYHNQMWNAPAMEVTRVIQETPCDGS